MNRKLTLAAAAALAASLSMSPTTVDASFTSLELSQVNRAIVEGDANRLLQLIRANRLLLSLPGPLGEALRAFEANPTAGTLASVNAALGGFTVAEIAAASGIY